MVIMYTPGTHVRAFEPEAAGFGEQIASVQLRIRDGLLHHENLDPPLEQFVERRRVEVLGPAAAQCDRHSADTASRSSSLCTSQSTGAGGMPLAGLSDSSTVVPHDHTTSNSADSVDTSVPSDGTISLSLGDHHSCRS